MTDAVASFTPVSRRRSLQQRLDRVKLSGRLNIPPHVRTHASFQTGSETAFAGHSRHLCHFSSFRRFKSLESLIAEASGESSIATGIDKSAERSKAPRIVLPVEWVVDIADKDNDWFVATAYTYNGSSAKPRASQSCSQIKPVHSSIDSMSLYCCA